MNVDLVRLRFDTQSCIDLHFCRKNFQVEMGESLQKRSLLSPNLPKFINEIVAMVTSTSAPQLL